MYILIFVLILGVTTYYTNSKNNINSQNNANYTEYKYMFICLALGIILQIIKFTKGNIIFLVGYTILTILISQIVNYLRMNSLKKEKEIRKSVYQSIDVLFPRKIISNTEDDSEIDNLILNLPFNLKMKKDKKDEIESIEITIDNPNLFNDKNITQATYSLNKFLSYNNWVPNLNFLERSLVFIGKNHPPTMAKYPGSDLRPWNWIPLGVNEEAEIAWNLGAKSKNLGESLFIFENGTIAKAMDISKSPQCLAVGSTGGGKSIWLEQEIW